MGGDAGGGCGFIDASGISEQLIRFQGLVNNHVYTLTWARARTLAGSQGGLSILDGEATQSKFQLRRIASLKHNWITAMARVGDGRFIGTYGAGALKTDAVGRWRSFLYPRGEIDINANAMIATQSAVYGVKLR